MSRLSIALFGLIALSAVPLVMTLSDPNPEKTMYERGLDRCLEQPITGNYGTPAPEGFETCMKDYTS